jgi:4-hydroxybenzoate polyprenyltransferase
MHVRRMRSNPYLQLIRPANVVTAVADILAGYAVAGLGNRASLTWLAMASACLYAGGVVLNDVFDREVDRRERPERPIPSGRVTARSAAILGAVLLAAGVGAAAVVNPTAASVAALTAFAILLYDGWTKRFALAGPVNMGLCRGLNLLLGVSVVPHALEQTWMLGALPLVYIAAVTALSRGEVHGGRRGVAAYALLSLTVVLAALFGLAGVARSWAGVVLAAVLGWRVLPPFAAAYRSPDAGRIRSAIRTGVLSLVILDAVIGATYRGPIYGLLILATGVVAGALARVFAVT